MKRSEKHPEDIKQEATIIDDFKKSLDVLSGSIDAFVYPLIIPPRESINEDVLFKIYADLKAIGKQKNLHVLLYSYGGDAHTAFHIGRLLQTFSDKELKIYILREAKSAATLMAMAADSIVFTEISELGPMDPQIAWPKIDRRFSPLAIKHTLDLLHGESLVEHSAVVKALAERLPDPITLGEAIKTMDTGKDYIRKLLKGRMFKEAESEKVDRIAEQLVVGYPDHGYCIDFKEAQDIGLKVEKVSQEIEIQVFELMRSFKEIWDKFEFLFKKAKGHDSSEFKEAVDLVIGLRKAASDIVNKQIRAAEVLKSGKKQVSEKELRKKSNGVT